MSKIVYDECEECSGLGEDPEGETCTECSGTGERQPEECLACGKDCKGECDWRYEEARDDRGD